MKLHSVELRHVRHIKALTLDLSAPLTVLAGPNGAGKTTVQQAILAAMFLTAKDRRDSFHSRFDPDSPPTVVLRLSRDDRGPTIELRRCLSDDKGEWIEGGATLKRKKQALEKVQEVLPISADAAALLLWGRQEDMAAVVDAFPADGYKLLADAAIRGSGPDPKEILEALQKDFEQATRGERGGKVVGELTAAQNRVVTLERELAEATAAEESLQKQRANLEEARKARDQAKDHLQQLNARVQTLAKLEKLLGAALDHAADLTGMVAMETDQAALEKEIQDGQKVLQDLRSERDRLRCQYRVARDTELGRQIAEIGGRIHAAEKLASACAELEKELKARKRPQAADLEKLERLARDAEQIKTKIEATGVRYEITADSATHAVQVTEDGASPEQIRVAPGQAHERIVGRVVIQAAGLRISAAGKEDIAAHRRRLADKESAFRGLLQEFAVDQEPGFRRLAEERTELTRQLEDKRGQLKITLGPKTLEALKLDLQRLEDARSENSMSLQDQEACAGKDLASASEIRNRLARKDGELEKAEENISALEEKRPTDADKRLLKANLAKIRQKARESAAAFKDADELHREPARELHQQIERELDDKRTDQAKCNAALLAAERNAAGIEGQLKQAVSHRASETIRAELQEAKQGLARQQFLQQGRALLKERLEAKIADLAAHVPIELGKRVTEHLSRMTGGLYGTVSLKPELHIADVSENGDFAERWQTKQLSYGERHQAALAVKVAVARALAETSGPVFIMLDDSLVSFDPDRRARTEESLLHLVADGKLQVILLTCHTDWAADWKRRRPSDVQFIELSRHACYYRDRRAEPQLAASADDRS